MRRDGQEGGLREHIIQFGFTIDDDAIKKNVEAQALSAVVEKLSAEIKSNLPKRYGSVDWDRVAYNCVESFIDENKSEIMDMAANRLVESVKRTKVWKERYGKALESGCGKLVDKE